MTTMFIQLRRVVYLLVLLHFCTCAINSVSGTPSRNPDVSRLKEKIDGLKAKFEEQKEILDGTLSALNTARKKYKTTAQRAQSDANECREFAEEMKSGLTDAVDNENKGKAKELERQCTWVARDVKNAAVEAGQKADDHVAAAEKYMEVVFELYRKSVALSSLLRSLEEKDTSYAGAAKQAFEDLDEVRAIKSSAKKVKRDATKFKQEIADAQEMEKTVAGAAELLENIIQNPKTAGAAKESDEEEIF